jgi:uncharacterized membrane protein YphA (DoxX/SURF4 family)
MSELTFASQHETRNVVGDWAVRIAVAVAFVVFGSEKFSSGPASQWVTLFRQIGFGEWFRYLTGAVEIAGGLLVLFPRTALAGFGLLAATMAGAMFIVAFVLGRPGDAGFPGVFLVALIAAAVWTRKNH